MKRLPPARFDEWRQTASVLEKDRFGDKVLKLADGTFLKIFRRKSLLSKTLFNPPAQRFAANAASLRSRGVPCPEVIAIYRMDQPFRSLVHYHPLPGVTLRQLVQSGSTMDVEEVLKRLPNFIRTLHEAGVYFRSLHLGNIVLTPEGKFGLIDISDLRCFPRPLSRWLRSRNYKHLLRYTQDWEAIDEPLRSNVVTAITGTQRN